MFLYISRALRGIFYMTVLAAHAYNPEVIEAEQRASAEFDRANELHELATNITERIGYPMNHLVDYELINGEAWCLTAREPKSMRQITLKGVEDGVRTYSGNNLFQLERLQIEHEEVIEVDKMFRGELQGNVMVVVSQIPDAVRDGHSTVNGYRPDLMRSLARVYYVTDDNHYRCRMFSLDRTTPRAMAAMAGVLGAEYMPNDTSERNLARRRVVHMSSVTDEGIAELVDLSIGAYSSVIHQESGVQTNAGSLFLDHKDALAVVKLHGSLLEECRRTISIIAASHLSDDEKSEHVELQLRKTTGAINAMVDGHTVNSSGDGIVASYVASHNYQNDCPTGATPLEQTVSQEQTEQMSGEVVDHCMKCPYCKKTGVKITFDHGAKYYTCVGTGGCGATTLPQGMQAGGSAKQSTTQASAKTDKAPKPSNYTLYSNSLKRIREIKAAHGADAEEVRVTAVGEELRYVRNRKTGEFIEWLD